MIIPESKQERSYRRPVVSRPPAVKRIQGEDTNPRIQQTKEDREQTFDGGDLITSPKSRQVDTQTAASGCSK